MESTKNKQPTLTPKKQVNIPANVLKKVNNSGLTEEEKNRILIGLALATIPATVYGVVSRIKQVKAAKAAAIQSSTNNANTAAAEKAMPGELRERYIANKFTLEQDFRTKKITEAQYISKKNDLRRAHDADLRDFKTNKKINTTANKVADLKMKTLIEGQQIKVKNLKVQIGKELGLKKEINKNGKLIPSEQSRPATDREMRKYIKNVRERRPPRNMPKTPEARAAAKAAESLRKKALVSILDVERNAKKVQIAQKKYNQQSGSTQSYGKTADNMSQERTNAQQTSDNNQAKAEEKLKSSATESTAKPTGSSNTTTTTGTAEPTATKTSAPNSNLNSGTVQDGTGGVSSSTTRNYTHQQKVYASALDATESQLKTKIDNAKYDIKTLKSELISSPKDAKAIEKQISQRKRIIKKADKHVERLIKDKRKIGGLNPKQLEKKFGKSYQNMFGGDFKDFAKAFKENIQTAGSRIADEATLLKQQASQAASNAKHNSQAPIEKARGKFANVIEQIRQGVIDSNGNLDWNKAEYKVRKAMGDLTPGEKLKNAIGKYTPRFLDVNDPANKTAYAENSISNKQAAESGFHESAPGDSKEKWVQYGNETYPNDPERAKQVAEDGYKKQQKASAAESSSKKTQYEAAVKQNGKGQSRIWNGTKWVAGAAANLVGGAANLATVGTYGLAKNAVKTTAKVTGKVGKIAGIGAIQAAPTMAANFYRNSQDLYGQKGRSVGKQLIDLKAGLSKYGSGLSDEAAAGDKFMNDKGELAGYGKGGWDFADGAVGFGAYIAGGAGNLQRQNNYDDNSPEGMRDRLKYNSYVQKFDPSKPDTAWANVPGFSRYDNSNYTIEESSKIRKAADVLGLDIDGINAKTNLKLAKAAIPIIDFGEARTSDQFGNPDKAVHWGNLGTVETRRAKFRQLVDERRRSLNQNETTQDDIALMNAFNSTEEGDFNSVIKNFNQSKYDVANNPAYAQFPESYSPPVPQGVDPNSPNTAGTPEEFAGPPVPPPTSRPQGWEQYDAQPYKPWERQYPEGYEPEMPDEIKNKYDAYAETYKANPNANLSANPDIYKSLDRYGNSDMLNMSDKDRAAGFMNQENKGGNDAVYAYLNAKNGYLRDNNPKQAERRRQALGVQNTRLQDIGKMQQDRYSSRGLTAKQAIDAARDVSQDAYKRGQDELLRGDKLAANKVKHGSLSIDQRFDIAEREFARGIYTPEVMRDINAKAQTTSDTSLKPWKDGRNPNIYAPVTQDQIDKPFYSLGGRGADMFSSGRRENSAYDMIQQYNAMKNITPVQSYTAPNGVPPQPVPTPQQQLLQQQQQEPNPYDTWGNK